MVDDFPDSHALTLRCGLVLPAEALSFTYSRSGGPGGQNVNKLATRATLTVHFDDLAKVMPRDALVRLKRLAGQRYADDPARLMLSAADSRSQIANRRAAETRLLELLNRAMHKPRPRRPTKPTRSSIRKRIEQKKQRGDRKRERRRPNPGD